MFLREGRGEKNNIVVIGGCGKVGQNLIFNISAIASFPVTYFARDFSQASRISACIQDCLTNNVSVSLDKKVLHDADVIIFICGRSTDSGSNKDSLYEINKGLIQDYIQFFTGKDIILVSNPCTQLGAYIEQETHCYVYGVGVQNDFCRAHYQNDAVSYVIGAHNIFEQCHYNTSDYIFFDGFVEHAGYQLTRLKQNRYLERNFDYLLYCDLNRIEQLKWWKIQRFHSLKNSLAMSCAKSIVDILLYLMGEKSSVHAEVRLVLNHSIDVFIGLPIIAGEIGCPHSTINEFLNKNEVYLEKYKIEKN
ncbi:MULTISPECIES: hypothetical protein [Pantoea]|uniref:hypothetical protein n=1 Tax=Pantoea TaxID=53335 RepID=UPI001BFFA12A|nr:MULTISPECIES: hypothetical protein [Pantoea]MBU6518176.1 hypothetical protein [Pantoea sp. B270]MCH9407175.1 hypothetical protein [Pantoea agglomerans]MDQ0628219.1 hypothetical protein [Pantoea agglomerans]MDY0995859.1 hypothetical protein [Pantoea agglomerans]WNK31843.1 hypothetical protein RM157_06405 [Pantoea agglomerans]